MAATRARDQPAMPVLERDAVVRHQAREDAARCRDVQHDVSRQASTCPRPSAPRIRTPASPIERRSPAWMVVSRRLNARLAAGGQPDRRSGRPSASARRSSSGGPARFSARIVPAMRLDDLARDRQAEARILAETLLGPVGVEALEDAVERVRVGCPGPSSSTSDLDLAAAAGAARPRTVPSGGEKERALSMRLLKTWPSRLSWPITEIGVAARGLALDQQPDRPARPWRRRSLATDDHRLAAGCAMSTGSASARASSASRREASEMSLISRSSRRTSCWMIDMQAPARLVASRERQGLDRAAQRGQRVLQLVRDVGREALDRVDAVVERPRHVAQRARQMADLVRAAGEIGDLLARLRCRGGPARPPPRGAAPAPRWRRRAASTARSSRRPRPGRPAGARSARRR